MFWMWVGWPAAGRQEDVTVFLLCSQKSNLSVDMERHQRPRVNGTAVSVGRPYHQKGIFIAVAFRQETETGIELQRFVPKALLYPAVHQHLHAWLLWHLALQWSYSSAGGSGSFAKWCDLDQLPPLDGGLEDLLRHELLLQALQQIRGKCTKDVIMCR